MRCLDFILYSSGDSFLSDVFLLRFVRFCRVSAVSQPSSVSLFGVILGSFAGVWAFLFFLGGGGRTVRRRWSVRSLGVVCMV